MGKKAISVFFIMVLVLASCAGIPEASSGYSREAQSLIKERVDEKGITGLSAAVVYDGKILFSEGFGSRDGKEGGKPVTEHTLFHIASVTKLFTAMAVMQLAEEGSIEIDEDIRMYISGFNPKLLAGNDGRVTVRDLLTHHSGIPSDFMYHFQIREQNPDYFMNMSEWLSDEYLTSESGQVFAYNNAGFSLLGELIATVSGMSYARFIEERIFKKVGMDDSLVFLDDKDYTDISGGFSAGKPESAKFIRDIPAGSILSSASDMARLMTELLSTARGKSHRILDPETLDSMFTQQNKGVILDGDFMIGLGFWLKDFHSTRMAEHGGTLPPFHSAFKLLPEEGIGVFISSNDNTGGDIAVDLLAEDILELLLKKKSGDRNNGGKPVSGKRKLTEEEIAHLTGDYAVGNAGIVQIRKSGNRLIAHIPQMGIESEISAMNDGSFRIRDVNMRLTARHSTGSGRTLYFLYLENFFMGPMVPISKVELTEPLKRKLGRYNSIEKMYGDFAAESLSISYDEENRDLMLFVGMAGRELPFPLKVLSGSLLQIQGRGRNTGYVLESYEENGNTYIRYGGITFIKAD